VVWHYFKGIVTMRFFLGGLWAGTLLSILARQGPVMVGAQLSNKSNGRSLPGLEVSASRLRETGYNTCWRGLPIKNGFLSEAAMDEQQPGVK